MVATSSVFTDIHPEVRFEWTERSLAEFAAGRLDAYLGEYDLVALDHPLIGEASEAGWLQPLEGLLPDDVLAARAADAIGASAASYRLDGKTWALALDAAALATAFRPDLVDRAPATIDGLLRLADGGARVAVPFSTFSSIAIYLTGVTQLGATAFAEPLRVAPEEVGIQVIETMRELARRTRFFGEGSVPLLGRLGSGELDLVAFAYGYSTYARSGYFPHRVSFAEVPTFAGASSPSPTLGGVGLALLAGAPEPEAALRYAAWVTSPEVQAGLFTTGGGQPASRTAWDDPALDALNGGFFSATRASVEGGFVRPTEAWYGRMQERAGRLLQESLRSSSPAVEVQRALDACYAASREGVHA